VLVNRDRKRAQGVVTDVQYGAVLSPPIAVRDGDYSDLTGSSVVMITAGVNEKGGGATDRSDPVGRLRLLEANAAIFQDIVPKIHHFAPDALILVVTDPPDALADVVRMLGHERVLSTGTSLDTLRFRFHLGKRLNVSASDVEALVLGEHGVSSGVSCGHRREWVAERYWTSLGKANRRKRCARKSNVRCVTRTSRSLKVLGPASMA
jgi:L-lactate dehydrogenase